MTRIFRASVLLALIAAAFMAGRASATFRPAQVIPDTAYSTVSVPAPGRTGAPQFVSGPVVSHPAYRGNPVPHGGVPHPGAVGSPSPARLLRSLSGVASTYGPGFAGRLALPGGPGIRVRICGPAACVTRTSNDAGPSLAMQRLGRIVDLDVATFQTVCGCPWTRGLVPVTVAWL